jgi:hypothetical protein
MATSDHVAARLETLVRESRIVRQDEITSEIVELATTAARAPLQSSAQGGVMARMNIALCLALVGLALLAACATASREAAFRAEEVELFRARQETSIACTTAPACDDAWARTRAFIQAHSATRIVQADDAVIQTAFPHAFGFVYLAASKDADGNGGAAIRLKAMCRGMYDSDGNAGPLYSTCAKSIISVEARFRAWLQRPDN